MAPKKKNNITPRKEKKPPARSPGKIRKTEKPQLKTPSVIKYKFPPKSKCSHVVTTSNCSTDNQKINNIATKTNKSNTFDHSNQETSPSSKTQEIQVEKKQRKRNNKLDSTCTNQDKEKSPSSKTQEIQVEKKQRKRNNKLDSTCSIVNQDKGNIYARRKITFENNNSTNDNESAPKLTKQARKKLDKLSLANEVAMAQFPKRKKCNISEDSPIVISITNTSFVNNKISPEITRVVENDTNQAVSKNPFTKQNSNLFTKRGKGSTRERAPKRTTNDFEKSPKVTRKRKADSTITKLGQIPKVELITRTIHNTLCNGGLKDLVNIKGKDSTCARETTSEDDPTSPSILNQVSLEVENPKVENNRVKSSPRLKRTRYISKVTSPCAEKITEDLNSQSQVKREESDGLSQHGSRRSSNSYISDYLSWTKDISSSSTTTCITVNSDDVVRIDGKLPVVRLHNKVTSGVKTHEVRFLSSSESTTDNSVKESEKEINSLPETSDFHLLNLSTASSAEDKSDKSYQGNDTTNDSKIKLALDKMSLSMKLFDLEFINWTQYNNADSDITVSYSENELFVILKEEQSLIDCCRRIKCELSDAGNNRRSSLQFNSIVSNELGRCPIPNELKEYDTNTANNIDGHSTSVCEQKTEETSKNKYYYPTDQNDDDDALSLFAESLSGIESSKERTNDSVLNNDISVPDFEEYVPLPISNIRKPAEISYYPTKISEQEEVINENPTIKTVCEKQNADSTSINRIPEQEEKDTFVTTKFVDNDPVKVYNDSNFNIIKCNNVKKFQFFNENKLMLMKDFPLKPIAGVKSCLFRGVCFYNLISNCKRSNCVFPHRELNVNEIENRLVTMSEIMLIQEYILIRKWPELRRKFSICFVNAAIIKKLPRIVMEMALDSITNAKSYAKEDKNLKVSIIENILSYLNNTNLEICRDLFLYNVGQGVLLCDVFMEVLAETQNFSRFKSVFINLTDFIVKNGRRFAINVASYILERVCILPFDKLLYHALIKIMHNTSVEIFENSMIEHLKKVLATFDNNLLQELMSYKEQDIPCEISYPQNNFNTSSQINQEHNHTIIHPHIYQREKRYTSPDTTNMDNVMKGVTEPVFTRTINLPQYTIENYQCNSTSTSTSVDSVEDQSTRNTPRNTGGMRTWNTQSIFNKLRNVMPPMRFGIRPLHNRHMEQRRVAFLGSPTMPLRRPGPRFS